MTQSSGGQSRNDTPPNADNSHHLNPTLLVVDDDILIRMPIANYLRDMSYRVIEASNAAEAMSVLESGEPVEVVFSDVFMPGDMNGIALARWIRRKYPDVRVILTSGAAVADDILPGDTDTPLLAKPYTFSDVAEKIRRLTTI